MKTTWRVPFSLPFLLAFFVFVLAGFGEGTLEPATDSGAPAPDGGTEGTTTNHAGGATGSGGSAGAGIGGVPGSAGTGGMVSDAGSGGMTGAG